MLGGGALATGPALYHGAGTRHDDCKAAISAAIPCTESRIDWTQTPERGGIGLLVTGGVLLAVDLGPWAAWGKGRQAQ